MRLPRMKAGLPGTKRRATAKDRGHPRQPLLWDLTSLPSPEPEAAELIAWIGEHAGTEADIRVCLPDAQRLVPLLTQVAEIRRCDIYLARPGTELRDTSQGPISVRVSSGMPVDWSLIRPAGVPDDAASWFECVAGRVKSRTGIAVVRKQECVAFVTRSSFLDTVALVAQTFDTPAGMTPVVATIVGGQFGLGDYDGTVNCVDGAGFGRALHETIDEMAPEVRLSLAWPADPASSDSLDRELSRLASALDRVVWAPARHGGVTAPAGALQPLSRGLDGHPAPWRKYDPATPRESNFLGDRNGLLVPALSGSPQQPDAPEPAAQPPSSQPVAASDEVAHAWELLRLDHPDLMARAVGAFRSIDLESAPERLRQLTSAWFAYLRYYEDLAAAAERKAEEIGQVMRLRCALGRVLDVVSDASRRTLVGARH